MFEYSRIHYTMSFHLPGKNFPSDNLDDHDPDQFRPPAFSGSGQGFKKFLEPASPTKRRASSVDASGLNEPQTKLSSDSTCSKNFLDPTGSGRKSSPPSSGLTSVIAPYFALGTIDHPTVGRPSFLRQQSQSHPDLTILDNDGHHNNLDHFGEDVFKSEKIMFYAPSKSYCAVTDVINADFDTSFASNDNYSSINKAVHRSSTAAGRLNSSWTRDVTLKGYDKNWMTNETDGQQKVSDSAPATARNESNSARNEPNSARNESSTDSKRANFGIDDQKPKKFTGLFQLIKESEFFSRPVKVTHYDINTLSPSTG